MYPVRKAYSKNNIICCSTNIFLVFYHKSFFMINGYFFFIQYFSAFVSTVCHISYDRQGCLHAHALLCSWKNVLAIDNIAFFVNNTVSFCPLPAQYGCVPKAADKGQVWSQLQFTVYRIAVLAVGFFALRKGHFSLYFEKKTYIKVESKDPVNYTACRKHLHSGLYRPIKGLYFVE